VFSGSVARTGGRPGPGETVRVEAADGTFLAWAAYNEASQIIARVWSFDEHDVIDEAFVAARITAAVARRHSLCARTNGMRLVFSESDGVPGLIADRYAGHVVVELTTAGAERWRGTIADVLGELPGVESVFERSDVEVRRREGLDERVGLLRGPEPPQIVEFDEDGLTFLVDVRHGHKTGFYLDQRESRHTLACLAPGRRMLNVFCYTGAFTAVAARAGATSTMSIDSSGPSLALAARLLERNAVPAGELVEADAFAELRRLRSREERFGLIVVDPPKLAHRADQVERSTRAYKDLNLIAFQLLEPGGMLVTFSCSGLLDEALFQKVVAGAALDARREARIVDRLHHAGDHPVHLAIPETAYLKGLVCQVD
jgi:23S rRNA (cytosine1962-C5)-methyltransferase